MRPKTLIGSEQLQLTIDRLCHELIEQHNDFSTSVFIGVQPRGVAFAERLYERLKKFYPELEAPYGILDPTFYRDDFRRREEPLTAHETNINFSIEGKKVILIDDVLYTARTIRSAMDALLDYGRPSMVELLVLIERRFSKQVPITADYIGQSVDAIASQKVKVEWAELHGKDRVILLKEQS